MDLFQENFERAGRNKRAGCRKINRCKRARCLVTANHNICRELYIPHLDDFMKFSKIFYAFGIRS